MITIQSEMKNLLSQLEKSQPHAKRSNGENGWKWISDNIDNDDLIKSIKVRTGQTTLIKDIE